MLAVSQGRLVALALEALQEVEFLRGGEPHDRKAANIKAAEGKTRAFKAEMVLKTAELERLFAEGAPPALLRVTVTVQSDK